MEISPQIAIKVDPTNPGQYFACCGLLELAARLWPTAEGWFGEEGKDFYIAFSGETKGTLIELLATLGTAKFESSLGDTGLKRLASLLSKNKNKLTAQDAQDKKRLQSLWKVERVNLSSPFNLSLDWWWDKSSGMEAMKTWAAKQFVIDIVRPMLAAIDQIKLSDKMSPHCLSITAELNGLPFYFDAANNTQNTPRDYGVAPALVKIAPINRPLVELLAFIGLQRFRPSRPVKSDWMYYSTWLIPLAPAVAFAVVSGRVELSVLQTYQFRMLFRTEYMKAVLPAILLNPVGG